MSRVRAFRDTDWSKPAIRIGASALGLAALVLGAVLIIRPTTSLGVMAWLLGVALVLQAALEVLGDRDAERPGNRLAAAALWAAAGVVVFAVPGLTLRVATLVVAIALIVRGVLQIGSTLRAGQTPDARIAAGAVGVATVLAGILALSWPDITALVVAVAFGGLLIVTGIRMLVHAIRGSRAARSSRPAAAPSIASRWARTIGAVVALAVAVAGAGVSLQINGGAPGVDEFYVSPRDVPGEPGQLIRFEPFTREIPNDALAWRILYTTTTGAGDAAVASGLVVVPREGAGDWPVIDWTHGTTGVARQCAPSLASEPFESGALFALPDVIAAGWALVATDYIGLGGEGAHAYLVGADAAHAALDAVRAARQLDDADLGTETVVWGHSQGGGAALWTGALAEEYAPDVPLTGVAAFAPAANLPALVDSLESITGGSVFASFAIAGFTSAYPDVTYREYVRPGIEVTVREMATRCLAEPGVLVSVLNALALSSDPQVFSTDPTTGPLDARLRENIPPATGQAPLLLGQGGADSLIVPAAQQQYVDGLCAAGRDVDYRVYDGLDHIPLVEPGSPALDDLLEWTRDRFDGTPTQPGCR